MEEIIKLSSKGFIFILRRSMKSFTVEQLSKIYVISFDQDADYDTLVLCKLCHDYSIVVHKVFDEVLMLFV